MKRILLLVAALAITASCGGEKKAQYKDIDNLFTTVEKRKTERTAFQSEDLVEPIYKICVGRYLLIGNIFTDPMITVYDLESQKPVNTILSKGKADNEILQMRSLSVLDDKLIVQSSNDRKVAFMNTAQLSAVVPLIQTRKMGETQGVHCFRFCPIQGGSYVTTGYNMDGPNSYFYLLDSTLSLVAGFDTYPEPEYNQNMTPVETALGYQGRIVASPAGDYMVYSSADGCVLKFFDCTGDLPVKVQEYAIEIPRFTGTPDHSSARPDKKNIQGVLSTTTDDTYFYLLYSDKKNTDRKRVSKTVYIFDHKGTPVKKVELDIPVTDIVYSAYDDALYVFTIEEEGECELRKVDLRN